MVNYQNGKIYKIMFQDTNDVYVGSTCQPLKDRLSGHRRAKSNKKKMEAFKTNTHIRIILIEKYPCSDKEELVRREQHWIDELKPTLNRNASHSATAKFLPASKIKSVKIKPVPKLYDLMNTLLKLN